MNLSAPFIRRPVATTLLTLGVALAGIVVFHLLPVASLPAVDFPAINVSANMPGASPQVMASTVATPLERHLGTIADVTEMTSTSTQNSTSIQLIFGLNRDIDGAARDVQAAIVAARADLPTNLRSNPTYRKFNGASPPIVILTLTSKTLSRGQIYDVAATVLQQKLSQVEGVGNVNVLGSALPAVRVELNPRALFKYGIGLEDVRAALSAANANAPKGAIENDHEHFQIYTNDQASTAELYRPLIVAYRDGSPVRISDIGVVTDEAGGGVENIRNYAVYNGQPSITLMVTQQPAANIIETVNNIKALLPQLQAALPPSIDLLVTNDRSLTIRASLKQVEMTLVIAVLLVILVVYVFLQDLRATLIPAVSVPVSLLGTFGAMYLLGYSLDNFSLMSLTIATGFVVDDAIVVMENTTRHIEAGMGRMQAAFIGAQEVGFTVLSMSLSLVAVFLPLQLMGGLPGRLLHEFTVTLSVAIIISLVVSLTTTPMMCARLLGSEHKERKPTLFARIFERSFESVRISYERSLGWAVGHGPLMMLILLITICFNVYLYIVIPKGFFPQQDTGQLRGALRADQDTSFQSMKDKMVQAVAIIQNDPAVSTVVGIVGAGGGGPGGGGGGASANFNVGLKPLSERSLSADGVIARMRPQFLQIKGGQTFLQSNQDLPTGGRVGNAQYQYTLQGDDVVQLQLWSDKLRHELQTVPEVTDVDSDQQPGGLERDVVVDRDSASRLGLSMSQIDNTLYDAFGQRQVSTIFNPLNQYHVVMEISPEYLQDPDVLKDIFISTSGGAVSGTQSTNAVAGTTVITKSTAASASTVASDTARNAAANALANAGKGNTSTGAAVSTSKEKMVPLAAFAHFGPGTTPTSISHQGTFVATTIAFNTPEGTSLGQAVTAINAATNRINMPTSIHGSYEGSAKTFRQAQGQLPLLLLAALAAVYIVLGVLYESYLHPLTILSTLPSAGIGALLALLLTDNPFTLIAFIAILLLIGIVKKNAIMMIDVAIDGERNHGLDSREAILRACSMRFRPIMMTTLAAIFGALPLAVASGDGTEMRRPLGVAIVGGLLVSQMLTLYTTPVVYLYIERFGKWRKRVGASRRRNRQDNRPSPIGAPSKVGM